MSCRVACGSGNYINGGGAFFLGIKVSRIDDVVKTNAKTSVDKSQSVSESNNNNIHLHRLAASLARERRRPCATEGLDTLHA